MSETGTIALTNDHLRLALRRDGDAYSGYDLAVRRDGAWAPLAVGRFGRLVHLSAAGERVETPIHYYDVEVAPDRLRLAAAWTDGDGVAWTFEQTFSLLPADPRQVLCSCRATPSAARKVLHWSGPTLLVGEGSFGARKSDALFPGLEYLLDDEPSSDTAFAAESFAGRSVPHPYKITIPLMAVSHEGIVAGLIWDPNQEYGSAWRHPAALFASPNRLEGAENHLLGLFAPGSPRFVDENALEAKLPISAGPQAPLQLEARLVGLADATAVDVIKVWVDTYGLPELAPPHGYRENVELCVRSYLDVAWNEATEGWHHTLADPWGPRYEPRVIAQLWRYAQWPEGDPALRTRARDQVRRGLERAMQAETSDGNPQYPVAIPHLELALHYGRLAESLERTRRQVQALLEGQQANGSWPWRPELIAHASYNTEERRSVMGGEGADSSTGLTADRARTLLVWARLTGDPAAREAGLRAVDWCNAQRRPEGAQTWELHLHVPDILAAPYLIDVNLEAHALTGDDAYLTQAERWAWTGLPFTYLWRAYYRPIMTYCTVPVFGATFHDVQSWFGVDVHWNGLVYADALFRLATATDERRWRTIAEGIVACGMQQQPTDGAWLGMYPDAFSLVRGDEEYTWWLNPNLIGLNTFELAGLPLDLETTLLAEDGASPVFITSGAQVLDARLTSGALALRLSYPPGEPSHTLIAGLGAPARVSAGGEEIAQVADLERGDRGWRLLPETGLLIVKAPTPADGTLAVEVVTA